MGFDQGPPAVPVSAQRREPVQKLTLLLSGTGPGSKKPSLLQRRPSATVKVTAATFRLQKEDPGCISEEGVPLRSEGYVGRGGMLSVPAHMWGTLRTQALCLVPPS